MLALLQVEYQSKSVSPFETHPISMWVFVGATFIFCGGLATNWESHSRPATRSKIISCVIPSSGALASVSLASVFFPRLFGWLCLCLWAVLPVILAKQISLASEHI
ncbi:hypothetical protein Patl1_00217 [Pistacia atlantica]|uniref:Uncharacterized protein n=1 Tax=Pistacia atlantica TaxID=434234 RepID=A0ACC1CAP8_9ROSI|nr:hypothetical protein Patl1_00217 [Pistacia atlantica]